MATFLTKPMTGTMLLHNGDRLDQKTFHSLYKRTPPGFKAELFGGIVHVPSPVSDLHGHPHLRMAQWLGTYEKVTPGVQGLDNTTTILGEESEPQPDLCLRIEPEYGGRTWNKSPYVYGPVELAIEIANSSVAIDLHAKKRDYEKAGVQEYLVILVKERRAIWFLLGKQGYSEIEPDKDRRLKSKVFPGLWLDPVGIFLARSRRLIETLREGLSFAARAWFVSNLESRRLAARRLSRGRKTPDGGAGPP